MSDQIRYIASCCLHDPDHLSIPMVQTEHRLKLAHGWPIQTGSKVLEIGCGQGDCTAVLASIVGPSGHVTAIDPADLSYGNNLVHRLN
jgi:predicted methyltransferase